MASKESTIIVNYLFNLRNSLLGKLKVHPYDPGNPEDVAAERLVRWQRTAAEIFEDGIYARKGCSDVCVLFAYELKKYFIEAQIIKTVYKNQRGLFGTHSILTFYIGNQCYLWDVHSHPIFENGLKPIPIKEVEAGEYIQYKQVGHEGVGWAEDYFLVYAKGKSMSEMGFNSVDDEFKMYDAVRDSWNPPNAE